MGFDAFMQINKGEIKGDSTDEKHKEWIELDGYEYGIKQATGGKSSAQGYIAGGRADHEDFHVKKRLDSSSPLLHIYACNAAPIKEIVIELCRAIKDKTVFMKITMKNCIVSEIQPEADAKGDDLIPGETVGFRYSEIQWEYTPTKADGSKGAAIKAGWSTEENKKTL
ncbi:MAG: type VI secretion system tube protein Hcp [Phycisphaerae bacterium]|nr:type VI secretion system tube protein Hcp [Phycisphaerae bacterium]